MSRHQLLSDELKLELVNVPISLRLGLSRLATFCQNSSRSNVRILVDAEYSNINPALSLLTLGNVLFQPKYLTSLDLYVGCHAIHFENLKFKQVKGLQKILNKNEPRIWNTVQGNWTKRL